MLAALGLVITTACGSVEPEEIAGHYELQAIDGLTLPVDLGGDPCRPNGLICVLAGELWLLSDGTFTWWFYSADNSDLLDANGYYVREGHWENDGNDLDLDGMEGRWISGKVTIKPFAEWSFTPKP